MKEKIIIEGDSIQTENTERKREVTFADIVALLWLRKYFVLAWTVSFIILGVIYALPLPKYYTAEMSMMPEESGNKLGSLGAMVGLNMQSTEDAYTTDVYPDIVQSIPFIVDLFNVEVQMDGNDSTMTLLYYLNHKEKKPWWAPIIEELKPKKAPRGPVKREGELVDPFYLSEKETKLVKGLRNAIDTKIDLKSSEITISVEAQDPMVAAQLCDTVAARLQEYIVDYRTTKARQDLDYARMLNEEAKVQYYEAQTALADYQDANQGLATYAANTTTDRLKNEMSLAFSLYNQTSQKVQQCEARVQELTPVFAIVNPVTVPLKPTGPVKKFIVLGFAFVGFLIAACILLYPTFFGNDMKRALERERPEVEKQRKQRRRRRLPWRRKADEDDADDDQTVVVEDREVSIDGTEPYNLDDQSE